MSGHDTPQFTYPEIQPNNQIILTAEELAVLKECNAEGFSKRGVPCSVAASIGAFYALKYGLLKPHPRFGTLPTIVASGILGGVVGTLSYKSICVERALAVPNGSLRKQFEAMRGIRPSGARLADLPSEKFELDVQRPMVSGSQMNIYQPNNNFDGFTGVNTDGDQFFNSDGVKPLPSYSPGVDTYDELRQRNRDEYARSTSPRQYIPPPRAAAPQGQDYPPMAGSAGPMFEDTRPFDRDRVPQYNLD